MSISMDIREIPELICFSRVMARYIVFIVYNWFLMWKTSITRHISDIPGKGEALKFLKNTTFDKQHFIIHETYKLVQLSLFKLNNNLKFIWTQVYYNCVQWFLCDMCEFVFLTQSLFWHNLERYTTSLHRLHNFNCFLLRLQ